MNPFDLIVSRAMSSLLRSVDDLDDTAKAQRLHRASRLLISSSAYLNELVQTILDSQDDGDDPGDDPPITGDPAPDMPDAQFLEELGDAPDPDPDYAIPSYCVAAAREAVKIQADGGLDRERIRTTFLEWIAEELGATGAPTFRAASLDANRQMIEQLLDERFGAVPSPDGTEG
jgi:hypothetical protein